MNLESKVEAAFKKLLDSVDAGLNVYTGQGTELCVFPCIIIHAETSREDPRGSGNFHVDVEIRLASPADEQPGDLTKLLEVHQGYQDGICEKVQVDDLVYVLNTMNIDDLGVMLSWNEGTFHSNIDRQYRDHWRFRIYCCNTQLVA